MQANEINVSIDMLRQIDVGGELTKCDKRNCHNYYSAFNKLAKSAQEQASDDLPVLAMLSAVTSMHFRSENTHEPYGAMKEFEDRRTAIPDDITDESLDALTEWLPEITDSELKSRIADLLWLRRRNPEHAHLAISSYIDSAKSQEDPEHWTACAERIERALRIAAMFRRHKPEGFNNVVSYIEEILERYDGSDPLFLSIKLMRLLSDFKSDDVEKYTELSVKIAQDARKASNWHKAEGAWEVAEKWAAYLDDSEKRISIIAEWAETYAEQAEAGDKGLGSTHWMQKAITLYKRVPDSRPRRDELYKLLRGYQQKTLDDMTEMRGPEIDLTDSVEASINAVSGKSFEEALFSLVFMVARPPKYEDIKRQAEENATKFVFSHIFGSTHFDRDGLVVASVPSGLGVNDDDEGKVLWAEMLRTVQIHHNLEVQGAIEPARREVNLEHYITEEMVFAYIRNNPFVPEEFEYLYAKGLHAGLTGDFIVAAHILIPQLENCLRYVLQQKGVETTTLNDKGLQSRILMKAILEKDELKEVLGNDVVYDLQALLIENKYGNLRNEVSHGFMPTGYFFQPAIIYLWWLSLRLCLVPYFHSWKEQNAAKSDEGK